MTATNNDGLAFGDPEAMKNTPSADDENNLSDALDKIFSPKSRAEQSLNNAAMHMRDRASTYDAPQGERSMEATVKAFNAITGHYITEEQGWLFMEVLKCVRSQQGDYKPDNYEDAVAYAALRSEAAEKERGNE